MLIVTAIALVFASAGAMLVPAFVIGLLAVVLADRARAAAERELSDYKSELEPGLAKLERLIDAKPAERRQRLRLYARLIATNGRNLDE